MYLVNIDVCIFVHVCISACECSKISRPNGVRPRRAGSFPALIFLYILRPGSSALIGARQKKFQGKFLFTQEGATSIKTGKQFTSMIRGVRAPPA